MAIYRQAQVHVHHACAAWGEAEHAAVVALEAAKVAPHRPRAFAEGPRGLSSRGERSRRAGRGQTSLVRASRGGAGHGSGDRSVGHGGREASGRHLEGGHGGIGGRQIWRQVRTSGGLLESGLLNDIGGRVGGDKPWLSGRLRGDEGGFYVVQVGRDHGGARSATVALLGSGSGFALLAFCASTLHGFSSSHSLDLSFDGLGVKILGLLLQVGQQVPPAKVADGG